MLAPSSVAVLVTDSELEHIEAALASCDDEARLDLLLSVAWHLRQRDSRRALELVEQIRMLCAREASKRSDGFLRCVEARLQLIEGEVKWLFAECELAEQLAQAALATFGAHNDAIGCADAHGLLATLMVELGKPDLRDTEFALSAAAALSVDDILRVDLAETTIARWSLFGNLQDARARWSDRFAGDVSALHRARVGWIYDFRGSLAFQTGDYATALSYWLPMYDLVKDTGQLRRAITWANNIGSAFGQLHDHQVALEWMERGLAQARATGWSSCIGVCLMQTAEVLRKVGRLDAAHDHLSEALELLGGQPDTRNYALILLYLGNLLLDRREYDVALTTFTDLERIVSVLNQVDLRLQAQRGRAAALSQLGRRDDAAAAAYSALALAREQGNAYHEIEALRVLASIDTHDPIAQAPIEQPQSCASLGYLQQALAVAATIEGYTVPGDLLDAVAREYAQIGDTAQAYAMSLQAIASREKTNGLQAVNRAIAMQISHKTERMRADSEHHRALAASESRRAQTLQQSSNTLERLSVIGQEITAHLDANAIFSTLDRHVHGLLDATHFSIFLLDEAGLGLDCAFGLEDGKPLPPLRAELNSATSLVARCARERREVFKEDGPHDFNPNHIPGTLPSLTALFAPLLVGERLLGVMSIQSPQSHAYAERERVVFRSLCAYGAIGLDNAGAYRQLEAAVRTLRDTQAQLLEKNSLLEEAYREQERASLTDPLTGLHNRRFLLQHVESEIALTLRRNSRRNSRGIGPDETESSANTDLAFFMVDIDHFKAVNDAWGHAAGDMVLIEMRTRLQQAARASDYIIRWGGEEFLIVARNTNRLQAPITAQRIRAAVSQQPYDIGFAKPLHKTCSVGFACFPFLPAHAQRVTWSQVIELADQALYLAKRAGRDGWVGLYGTESSNPDDLFARTVQRIEGPIQAGELRVVSSQAGALKLV